MWTIDIKPDGFRIRRGFFARKTYRWRSVKSIYSTKMDKVTYEELFLILIFEASPSVSIGEFDKGFKQFEAALHDQFKGLNRDWRSETEGKDVGVRVAVYQK